MNSIKYTTDSLSPQPANLSAVYSRILNKAKLNSQDSVLPEIPAVDPDALQELTTFCKQHNILGLNFKSMTNPAAMLSMLKNKMGLTNNTITTNTKKNLLLD